nr:uncharacterized protein LOC105865222 isoform X2 [Microcebus murinus]
MGQAMTTPLSLVLGHFRDVRDRARNLSLEIKKGRFVTLCEAEWPLFNVGWPKEGSFDRTVVEKVKEKIFGHLGHPDQIPYIVVWQDLVRDPPPWMRAFVPPLRGRTEILTVQEAGKKGKPGSSPAKVLPDSNLYPDLTGLEWNAPTFNAPPPYNPRAALAAPAAPEVPAPQRDATGGEGGPAYGTRQRTGRTPDPEPVKAFPLRAVGPRGDDGTQTYQYWPFSTSDLYNWKSQNSNFSDNPRDLINLLDSVLFTHQPTWDDCQQLLKVLFTTEERERIQGEARKLVPGEDGRPTTNPRTIDRTFPLERPLWDYNEAEDLKDAFFSLAIVTRCQEIFAFEWQDEERGIHGQLTWTRLPQGFKNSPTLFNEALQDDLSEYRANHPRVTLLQYVDDLLLAAPDPRTCLESTKDLLRVLGKLGYRASAKKAQICKDEVTYLGYKIKGGQRWLTEAMKQTVLRIPTPTSSRELREFLGSVGYCRLWIPGFAEKARPLYEGSKAGLTWKWTEQMADAFQALKAAMLEAPALTLPDPTKEFHLYIDEKSGIAKGVLMQTLGPWKRPVAYLSKKLDPVAAGWPACLRMIAATALIVKDADKLTLGQRLLITTPHAIEGVLKQPPGRWITNARLTHYQGLLLDAPRIEFRAPTALNPATLLPIPNSAAPEHDCLEILAETQMAQKDLKDRPLPSSDLIWFTDGSSFVRDGHRYAGAAIVDDQGKLVWAACLPQGTSAQKAELIALTEALCRAQGKRLTVYTDSRYAFGTVHIHGALYRERGFITAEGKEIKHKPEILRLLEAVLLPKAVAVVHTPGHQGGDSVEARGNRRADAEAKRAAASATPPNVLHIGLPPPGMGQIPPLPDYSSANEAWAAKRLTAQKGKNGWLRDEERRLIVPETLGRHLLTHLHQTTHLRKKKMLQLLNTAQLRFMSQGRVADDIVRDCRACRVMQPERVKGTHAGRWNSNLDTSLSCEACCRGRPGAVPRSVEGDNRPGKPLKDQTDSSNPDINELVDPSSPRDTRRGARSWTWDCST